jgi:hypothetical protein
MCHYAIMSHNFERNDAITFDVLFVVYYVDAILPCKPHHLTSGFITTLDGSRGILTNRNVAFDKIKSMKNNRVFVEK